MDQEKYLKLLKRVENLEKNINRTYAIYINIDNIDENEIQEYINNVSSYYENKKPPNVEYFIVPILGENSKIVCLSPTILDETDETYITTKEALIEMRDKLKNKDFLKKAK